MIAIVALYTLVFCGNVSSFAGIPPRVHVVLDKEASIGTDGISSLSIDSKGADLCVASEGGSVFLVSGQSPATKTKLTASGTNTSFALKDKHIICSNWNEKGIRIHDLELRRTLDLPDASPFFCVDRKKDILGYCTIKNKRDRYVCIYDLRTMKVTETLKLEGDPAGVPSIRAFSANGSAVIKPLDYNKALIWESPFKKAPIELDLGRWWNGAHIAQSLGQIAIGYRNANAIEVWDYSNRKKLRSIEIPQESSQIWAVQYSPDEKYLAALNAAGKLAIYRTEDYRHEITISAHDGLARSLEFFPDSKRIATAGNHDGVVKIWRLNVAKKQ